MLGLKGMKCTGSGVLTIEWPTVGRSSRSKRYHNAKILFEESTTQESDPTEASSSTDSMASPRGWFSVNITIMIQTQKKKQLSKILDFPEGEECQSTSVERPWKSQINSRLGVRESSGMKTQHTTGGLERLCQTPRNTRSKLVTVPSKSVQIIFLCQAVLIQRDRKNVILRSHRILSNKNKN